VIVHKKAKAKKAMDDACAGDKSTSDECKDKKKEYDAFE